MNGPICFAKRAPPRASNDPNVAGIFDVVEHGVHTFIVMEYVEGESLAVHLSQERFPLDRVIAIGRQLASALIAAHAKGVVHRDLKPANIQLTPQGLVKVLDFGIARTAALSTGMTDTLEHADSSVGPAGTPGYMSPEQVIGHADERSDIFSLGVVLCEMATGRRPYGRGGVLDVLAALGESQPIDSIAPSMSRGFSTLVAKATAIDPQQRFQSAMELASALGALEHEPTRADDHEGVAHAASTTRKGLRLALAASVIPVAFTALGLLNTFSFNVTIQRGMPFAAEPWFMYPVWGVRSIVAPAFYISATAIVVAALRFVLRVLNIMPLVARPLTGLRTHSARFSTTIGLDDPIVLAQGIATLAVAALAVVVWEYGDLIAAWSSKISVAEAGRLSPLSPENILEQSIYGIVLDVLILTFGAGLGRLLRLRRQRRIRGGVGATVLAFTIVGVLVFLWEAPYRTFFQNKFERIEFAGSRCYILGERDADALIYCPDVTPPRNRVVRRDDPAARRRGIVESIFTPVEKPGS